MHQPHLSQWTRFRSAIRQWRLAERGISSAVIFILGFPLIMAAFGLGIDMMRYGQAKRIAQGRADLATQAGASMTFTTNNGAIRLGRPGDGTAGTAALNATSQLYVTNTAPYRTPNSSQGFLSCPSSGLQRNSGALPNSACQGGARLIWPPGGVDRNFNFCAPPGKPQDGVNRQAVGVFYVAIENMPTVFLRFLPGMPRNIPFVVESEALLRQQFC